jgi:integrase
MIEGVDVDELGRIMNAAKPRQRLPKKLPVIIDLEGFNRLLKGVSKPWHRLAYKLGFLCCLRVSEVVKLLPGDVDGGRQMLFIRNAKGGKDRYVPIPKPISIKELRDNLPIRCGVRALEIAFKKAGKASLGKDLHFHTLRHSGATYYLSQGMNIREIQNLLGHSRLDTTMIYTHVIQNISNTPQSPLDILYTKQP